MTGISNVELLHEIKDRTRVLKRIKFDIINDADMNTWLVSDTSPDSCRSICRLLGNVWVAPKHTSLQRCTTSHRRMQQMHLPHTDTPLTLTDCLLLIATSQLSSTSQSLRVLFCSSFVAFSSFWYSMSSGCKHRRCWCTAVSAARGMYVVFCHDGDVMRDSP